MKTLLTNLLSEQSTAHILILLIAFILFYFFLRREIRYEMENQTKLLMAEIKPIKEALTNHITDTDKRIDRLTDRFDKLYELLLKDKEQKLLSKPQ